MNNVTTAAESSCVTNNHIISRKGKSLTSFFMTSLLLGSLLTCNTASAGDSCKVVLCMFGMLTGNGGGSECTKSLSEYFAIQIKKKGKIKWDRTSAAREQFLNSCPGADQGINKKINDKFGKSNG